MFRSIALASIIAMSGGSAAIAQEVAPAAPEIQQIEGIIAVVKDDPNSFTDVRQRAR